jgi:hypothetical protein
MFNPFLLQYDQKKQSYCQVYPNDLKQLIDLINKARIQKGCPFVERDIQEEISTELSNMRKNRQRVKFREEDRMLKDERKSRKLPNKRITWIKKVIKVRLVPLVINIK